jgi:hypothetical protein
MRVAINAGHQRGTIQWMPLPSGSFAPAETSIPKVVPGFAKWHSDSHFVIVFGDFV